MERNVLITGGAGFIGSTLALGLKKTHEAWRITCLDNLRRSGSELNLQRLRKSRIGFVHGDIRSPSDLDKDLLHGIDTIIDCSAEPSVLAGVVSPLYVLQTNLFGTCSILEFAREANAGLLFLSTSRVYPVPAMKSVNLVELPTRFAIASNQDMQGVSTLGIAEDFTLSGHRTLYGTTKLASELLIEEYRQAFGLHAIINRCAVITGPWQMGKADQGVFVHWMAAHYFGTQLSYIGFGGTGKQVRDLLHVDDLLRLVDYQLTHFDDLDGETLNVGGGAANSLSLLETTSLCQQITGNKIPIKPVFEERPGDVAVFITDPSRVIEKTGWKPTVSPNRALQDIYEWISHNKDMLHLVLI